MKYSAFVEKVKDQAEELVFDVGSLYAYLQRLKDKRHRRGLRYALPIILVLILLAKLGGEDEPRGIAEWVKWRKAELREWLRLPREDMPHHSTYSRVVGNAVEAEEMEVVLGEYFAHEGGKTPNVVLALDGKTLRGTIDLQQPGGVHLLAAYLPESGVVLMQMAVDGKENEISTAPKLLKCLDLRNKVVTGDALLAQRELSRQITEAGGEYLWTVKGNQPQMREDIEAIFKLQTVTAPLSPARRALPQTRQVEKGHGRIEERTLTASSVLKGYAQWPALEQVFKIERRFTYLKSGRVTEEIGYGVTSLTAKEASPERLLALSRSHWGIENGLHYRRDVTLREDRCRLKTGHAPQVMAIINNLVLGLLLRRGVKNVPQARRQFDAQPCQALDLLLLTPHT